MIRISPPSMPPKLVTAMDEIAAQEGVSRAEFLRRAVKLRIPVVREKLEAARLLAVEVDQLNRDLLGLYQQAKNRDITPDSARHLARQVLDREEESHG